MTDSTERPTLLAAGGPGGDDTIALGPTTTFGREDGNDLVVDEMGVSRRHAEIVETEAGYALRDLNSSNGTFVNDQRITNVDYLLKDGDLIRLGPGEGYFVFQHQAAVEEPAVQPELVMQVASGEDERVALQATVTLGREAGNDWVIEDPGISRRHAEIVQTEAGFTLRDLGSTNGTYVNQQKIADVDYLLKDGDQIQLGTAERLFVFRHAVPAPVEPEPVEPTPAEPAPVQPTLIQPAFEEVVEGAEAPEPLPAEPAPTGLAGLLIRLRIRKAPPIPEVYQEPQYAAEDIEPQPLPTLAKIARAFRNLREDIALRRRGRIFTLSVENGITRAVVFEGPEVVAWGIADPADGSSDLSTGQQAEDTEAEHIGILLSDLRARRSLLVTELPLYIPLVRLLRLGGADRPKIGRRYLGPVVATEAGGTIPFDQDEVDIKWDLVEGSTEQEVMAIAVQKRVIDEHVQRLKEAAIGPGATFSQAAALGAATGVPDAMVVHLGSDQPAIVLVRDGVPRAVHQVFAPEGFQNPQDQAEALARAVEQMEGFNQTMATQDEGQSLPLVLTGPVPGNGQLEEELRQSLQREVLPLSPPVVYPEGFPLAEYATNVGLALLGGRGSKGRKKDSVDVAASASLLSARHLPAPIPFKAIAVFGALAFLALAAFNLTPRVNATVDKAERNTSLLESSQRQVKKVQASRNIASRLQGEARDARALTLEMKSRLAELESEMGNLGIWFGMIDTITKETPIGSRPPNVKVSDLKPLGNEFKLAGTAKKLEDALQYANNIRDSGLFINVSLRQVDAVGVALPETASGLEGVPGGGASAEPGPELAAGELSFVITATARSSLFTAIEEPSESE